MTTTATTAICSATSPDPSDSLSDCFLPQSESPSHARSFVREEAGFFSTNISRAAVAATSARRARPTPACSSHSFVAPSPLSLSFSLSAVAQFIDFLPSPATPTWRGTRASV